MAWERLKYFLLYPYYRWQERKAIKLRLKKLKERDPFIYK
jgi:hypothetical protein